MPRVAPALAELPIAPRDTEPVYPDETMAVVPQEHEVESGDAEPSRKPRDVSTRDILRAVVKLLIEKDLLTRAELMSAVRSARASGDPSDSA